MNNDITDKYGAVVLIKRIIETVLTDIEKNTNMKGSLSIVVAYLIDDMNDIQADIEKDFLGKIQGLSDIEKRDELND